MNKPSEIECLLLAVGFGLMVFCGPPAGLVGLAIVALVAFPMLLRRPKG